MTIRAELTKNNRRFVAPATRLSLLCILLSIGLFMPVDAARYRQAAYVTNAYFTGAIKGDPTFPQPEWLFNELKADEADVKAHFVLNLLVDRGSHRITIQMLNSRGKQFESLKFDSVNAEQNDWTYTVTGNIHGPLPDGGVFFRVLDSHNNAKAEIIGTFRLLTSSW